MHLMNHVHGWLSRRLKRPLHRYRRCNAHRSPIRLESLEKRLCLAGPLFNDVWQFNVETSDYEEQVADNAPAGRTDHAATGANGRMQVFFGVDENGNLHMRYSARTRNIIWKDDPVVEKATKFITGLFRSPETPIIRYRMKPGEGIISNNVLHRREAFVNGCTQVQQRLFYRARYYDRVAQTDVTTE